MNLKTLASLAAAIALAFAIGAELRRAPHRTSVRAVEAKRVVRGPRTGAAQAACRHGGKARVQFADRFRRPNGAHHLITNEFALFNPGDPAAVSSPNWEMTSGSFFSVDGIGWTGVPDT